MRYSTAMSIRIPTLAAMIAFSASVAPAAERAHGPVSAVRFNNGASGEVTVSARIIRTAARVGAGFAPPARMTARRTTVSAADGLFVPALVYDFE